jgi:phage FluMu protein Com
MNNQLLNAPSTAIRKTCPKCGYIRETGEIKCADCGKPLQKVSTIRILGVVLVLMGTSLLAIMGWLSLWIYGTMSNAGNVGSRFNGSPKDVVFIIFVFGLVISISLAATAGGLWQIVFGKRNKLIIFAVFGLGIIFAITGLAVALNK